MRYSRCPSSPEPTVLSWLSSHGFHVRVPCPSCLVIVPAFFLPVLCKLICRLFQRDLSRLYCPRCPVPTILSKMSCPGLPVPATFPRLSSPSYYPAQAVTFWTSWALFPVLTLLSRPSCPAVLTRVSFLCCPVQDFLSPSPVFAVIFCPSFPTYPVPAVPSQMSFHDYPAQAILFCCPVLAVQCCPFMAVLSKMLTR